MRVPCMFLRQCELGEACARRRVCSCHVFHCRKRARSSTYLVPGWSIKHNTHFTWFGVFLQWQGHVFRQHHHRLFAGVFRASFRTHTNGVVSSQFGRSSWCKPVCFARATVVFFSFPGTASISFASDRLLRCIPTSCTSSLAVDVHTPRSIVRSCCVTNPRVRIRVLRWVTCTVHCSETAPSIFPFRGGFVWHVLHEVVPRIVWFCVFLCWIPRVYRLDRMYDVPASVSFASWIHSSPTRVDRASVVFRRRVHVFVSYLCLVLFPFHVCCLLRVVVMVMVWKRRWWVQCGGWHRGRPSSCPTG